jgi:DNA polymerase elongation subunit (family B)
MAWRNIFYDSRNQSIHLWTWDENGNRTKLETSFEPYLYVEAPNATDGVSIFNTSLKKISFNNQFDRNKFVTETPIKRLFNNISCEQQFLLNTFSKDAESKDFLQFPLKVYFFDIETYSINGFPVPEKAEDKINLLTIYNSLEKKFYTWGLKAYDNKNDDVVYVYCSSETQLLEKFLEFWNQDPPDMFVGWNSGNFDIPYIMKRIENVLGEERCAEMSPVRNVFYRENVGVDKFGRQVNRWYIRGISHIDYMEAYKAFARGDRESYSLGYIGQYELKETKINIGGSSLATLADTDWNKFVDYNIQDVRLLVKLDDVLKYIKLIRTLSYKGFIPFEQSLGKVSMITGAIAHQASLDGLIIPTFKPVDEQVEYVGGYVHDPERGLGKDIVSYDANSLYPNTIITLNVSPETKLGKISNIENKKVTIKLSNGKSVILDFEKFKTFMQKEDLSLSKHNVLYTQKFKGVIPKFIDRLYSERVDAKEKMQKLVKKIKSIDDEKLKHRVEQEISDLDTIQYTYKILLNSIYGVFGQKYSPFYDIDHAASITLTGQAVVKQASEIVYGFVQKKGLNCEKKEVYKYGDTDSAYFSLHPLFNFLNINLIDEKGISEEARKIIGEVGEFLNQEITKWAGKELKSKDSRFVFKQEATCDVAVFMEKKKYIMHIIESEGMSPKHPFKYVGIEVVKSSFSESTKKMIRDVIESAILSQDKVKSDKILKQAYTNFCNMPIEEVSFRTKVSDIEKYERAIKSDGSVGLGTPVHTKGALYFNKILSHFNLEKKYEKIKSGNKIKWFYPSKNSFNFSSLAFSEEFPKEFNTIFPANHIKMFDKSVTPPVQRLYECIGWEIPKITMETETDLFDLFKK